MGKGTEKGTVVFFLGSIGISNGFLETNTGAITFESPKGFVPDGLDSTVLFLVIVFVVFISVATVAAGGNETEDAAEVGGTTDLVASVLTEFVVTTLTGATGGGRISKGFVLLLDGIPVVWLFEGTETVGFGVTDDTVVEDVATEVVVIPVTFVLPLLEEPKGLVVLDALFTVLITVLSNGLPGRLTIPPVLLLIGFVGTGFVTTTAGGTVAVFVMELGVVPFVGTVVDDDDGVFVVVEGPKGFPGETVVVIPLDVAAAAAACVELFLNTRDGFSFERTGTVDDGEGLMTEEEEVVVEEVDDGTTGIGTTVAEEDEEEGVPEATLVLDWVGGLPGTNGPPQNLQNMVPFVPVEKQHLQ